ncbi:REP-associated tyrosine transposase [Tateyamaria pelophila]|uniref:REP-associated tyrosine transposase n=1 Tax=Tateyamaria pelophila TaxID=328415 RepID=UPI001CBD0D4B|nr:transposase [Tateyamaria pelophila]
MIRLTSRMPSYTRSSRAGGTFFFTVRLADHRSDLLVRKVDVLRYVTRQTRDRLPFEINETVVLPNVIYAIWTLPAGDSDFSARWRMLKSLFSRNVPASEVTAGLSLRPGEKGVWQRRFWEHMIRDKDDFAAHRHMIHSAPVQAGLVNRMSDWPWSSVHRAIARGEVPAVAKVGDGYHPLPPGWRTEGAPYGSAMRS